MHDRSRRKVSWTALISTTLILQTTTSLAAASQRPINGDSAAEQGTRVAAAMTGTGMKAVHDVMLRGKTHPDPRATATERRVLCRTTRRCPSPVLPRPVPVAPANLLATLNAHRDALHFLCPLPWPAAPHLRPLVRPAGIGPSRSRLTVLGLPPAVHDRKVLFWQTV